MKTRYTLILVALFFISVSLSAQTKQTTKPPAAQPTTKKSTQAAVKADATAKTEAKPSDGQPSEAEQKAWMDYMTPGEMHKLLNKYEGEWQEAITFWMAPGAPESKANSKCSNTMILGGRYQESIHKGDMMGMPFEGHGLMGYDNVRKVLQSTWIDNMGTGIMTTEGKYDERSKTATLTGKMVDPGTGKVENVREVLKFIDDRNQKMEMYVTKNGKEYKNMEIAYTR